MTPARRHQLLGAAALATALASVWALDDDENAPPRAPLGQAMASERAPSAAVPAASAPDPTLWTLPERGTTPPVRKLFAATASAMPPPATGASAAAAAAPPAITLPFAFGGRLVTADGAAVLLNEGPQTYVLPVGASQGDFRLEADNGSQLEFLHVPSGQRLVLPLQP